MFDLLHSYRPESTLFQFGPISIHWYGIIIAAAGIAAFFVIWQLAKRYKIEVSAILDLALFLIIGALIASRLYYVIYAWEFYKDNLVDILKIWQGGLAIHGALIGGFIAIFLYCRSKKQNFLLMADIFVVGLILAQAIGRWGNYFNQEIFGLPTNLPWGIPIDFANRPIKFSSFEFFHPTFLYESLGDLLIFFTLLFFSYKRLKANKWRAGNIFLLYLILYSILRFGLEFLRTDYSPLIFGVRWNQALSAIIILILAAHFLKRHFKEKFRR